MPPSTPTKRPPPHLADSATADPVLQLREFLRAVHVMKMYASAQGIPIPEATSQRLGAIAPAEAAFAAQPPPGADVGRSSIPEGIDLTRDLPAAINAHAALVGLVAPATPDSILYTQPPVGIRDFFHRQNVIFWLLVAAFVAICGFIGAGIWQGVQAGDPLVRAFPDRLAAFERRLRDLDVPLKESADPAPDLGSVIADLEHRSNDLSAAAAAWPALGVEWKQDEIQLALSDLSDRPTASAGAITRIRAEIAAVREHLARAAPGKGWRGILCEQLINLFAAMLGAAFYTLYTANRYIVNRTFDRAYTTHYVVRFVLGIVAGVVLANFGEYLLTDTLAPGKDGKALALTQTLFALIGGYSADAVNAIFTRVAETLTTLVRGSAPQKPPDKENPAAKNTEPETK